MAGHPFSLKPVDVPHVQTQHRRIATPIPPPSSVKIIEGLAEVEPRSMGGSLPIVWDKAVDYQVFDREGNCWIDFTSTIFVANAGHANPEIQKAIEEQTRKQLLHNYCYPSEIRLKLLRKLLSLAPPHLNKAFLLSTGSEANECALKIARLYGQTFSPARNGILCFDGAMHGRTLGSQMMGGNSKLRAWIPHMDPEIYHLPFPWRYRCPWRDGDHHQCLAGCFHKSLQQLAGRGVNLKSIASVMVESYLGWGALFYTPEYMQAVRQWADENQALVVFDEVQAGFGRTGTWFAFEHYDVKPDLVCLGKGISSSLPMSALLGRKDLMDTTDPGSMSSTHSGNPLCCAAALANLSYLEKENIIVQAAEKGKLLRGLLLDLQKQFSDRVLSIEGRGMVYGVILVKPGTLEEDAALGDQIAEKAMQKGLLIVHTGRGSLKLGPPLTIPDEAIREAISVLKESIEECLPLEKAAR